MIDIALAPYFMTDALSYLTLGGTGYLAWRFVRAYERRRAAAASLRALSERVRLLETSVDRMESGLADAAEAQRFTMQVMMSRAIAAGDRRD